METLMIILSGVLVTVATYLILSKNAIRIILGTALLTHASHLLLMTMGGFGGTNVPIIGETGTDYVDPIPQALILTSIVISFGVTSFFLVLTYRTYEELGSDDMYVLRGRRNE
ncbi:MAG TPA: Na(+)/H(+) antiporter subunit C [Bacillota bacterium]|nr:Na(+)/H(+) antiporter subunit C [Bacillota bacterium]